jgi:biotin carboxyl carrier protein
VLAPIPGVILTILVKEGDDVAYGQDLCIIEAMKMRNAIKAARTGRIAAVRVAPGQTVNHHDVLMEYGE